MPFKGALFLSFTCTSNEDVSLDCLVNSSADMEIICLLTTIVLEPKL